MEYRIVLATDLEMLGAIFNYFLNSPISYIIPLHQKYYDKALFKIRLSNIFFTCIWDPTKPIEVCNRD